MNRMKGDVIDGVNVLIAGGARRTMTLEGEIVLGIDGIYILNGNSTLDASQSIT